MFIINCYQPYIYIYKCTAIKIIGLSDFYNIFIFLQYIQNRDRFCDILLDFYYKEVIFNILTSSFYKHVDRK